MPHEPMYLKIAAEIRKQIDTGVLAGGTQLPTEADLTDQYRASRNTVRDAIKRLTSEGLVETRPGQGTFVTMRIDPFVAVLSGDPQALGGAEGATYLSEINKTHRIGRLSVPRVEIQAPPVEVGRRLRIAPSAQVVSRHQMRYVDCIPWSLQTSFIPWSSSPRVPPACSWPRTLKKEPCATWPRT
jgi:GntR family transcriptional regulator